MNRDSLTDLWDRATLDTTILEQASRAVESGSPLSLVFIDIDHFKKVNDTHGHQLGDQVLRGVAALLRQIVTGKGEAYRYGGEELICLLPNHTKDEAAAVAERIRESLEAEPISTVPVTASFGVATIPEHASGAEGLVSAADEAVYEAKRLGRNLVRISGEREPDDVKSKPRRRDTPRRQPTPGGFSDDQKQFYRKQYLMGHEIKCPKDLVPFDVHDVTSMGSVGREFLVSCPLCGFSDTLDNGE